MANFDLKISFPHEKQCLYTKREFLASQSPVFRRLIYENPNNPKSEVQVSDVNSMIVHHALQCINTAGASLASVRLSVLLRRFAKDYQMRTLFGLCGRFLAKRISVENVEVIHDLACHCSDTNIQFYCWLKFDSSWREIFSKASFYQCSDSTIKRFVSRPIYNDLDEFFLWNALYTWGLTKMLRENSIDNPILHRKILEEFLPNIRFLIMKSEELKSVFNSNILTKEECAAIRTAYITNNANVLPPYICRSTLPRTTLNLPQHVKHVYSHFCPKHTSSRFVWTNDHFYAEFVTTHDCFLLGVTLPIAAVQLNAQPLIGEMEISVTNQATNKKEQNSPWKFSVSSPHIKLLAPVLVEASCTVCVNLSILAGNLNWQIEQIANCDIGQLGKIICENAETWHSFYVKDVLLYF